MRLFTAIDLPAAVLDNLDTLLRKLRPLARIKWSRLDNLHLTTKFIGEWPAERLDELLEALRGVEPMGEIPVSVRNLGWFPNPRAPRVFWAGIDADEELSELARRTEAVAAELGVPVEKRRFSPHLTLARIKGPAELRGLRQALEEMEPEFGSFRAGKFFLYESERRPGGSVYTKLAGFGLDHR